MIYFWIFTFTLIYIFILYSNFVHFEINCIFFSHLDKESAGYSLKTVFV